MSKAKSVYLTERSMSALRPGDTLSGRINQVVDRYLQIVADERDSLLEALGSEGLADVIQTWPELPHTDDWLQALRTALKHIHDWSGSRGVAQAAGMCDVELIVLAEMVEAERASMVALG